MKSKVYKVTLRVVETAEIEVRATNEDEARADALEYAKYLDWHSREVDGLTIEEIPGFSS